MAGLPGSGCYYTPTLEREIPETEISPLRRRMIEDMTVRNLSPATQRSYVHAVAKFGRFFSRSPERLGLEEVRSFHVHLVAAGISWPALDQTVCALRFLYGVTLKQAELPKRIPYARTPRKLPVVRIRPARATVQVDRLRLVGGLRVHALASAATSSASASTSTALGSKVSPIQFFISAWFSCAGSAMASRNSA